MDRMRISLNIWRDPDVGGYHATLTADVHAENREEGRERIEALLVQQLEALDYRVSPPESEVS